MMKSTVPWQNFRWQGADLGGRYFPHAVMYVLATLPALNGLQGWFQFDLGAPTTMLYAQAFTPEQKAALIRFQQQGRQAIINGQEAPLLEIPLRVGPWEITLIAWYRDFGDEDTPPDGKPVLGTIGADLVRGHILAMDFPAQRLARLERLPAPWEKAARWTPLRLTEHGHIMIEIEVDGRPRWALWDTGSSIFELLTDASQWAQLSEGHVTHALSISAWGETKQIPGGPLKAQVRLGGMLLPMHTVHYSDDEGWQAFFSRHEMIGIMGNAPFLEHTIVLDFPRGRFGVLSPAPATE